MVISPLAAHLAAGPPVATVPGIVDVNQTAPPNPPEQLQLEFVGLSFEAAYAEAEAFVSAVADELEARGGADLRTGRVLDFGSGWGRISRVLLTQVPPERLFAVDVDSQMTALVNTTLPGINALTVSSSPPTVLADDAMDVAVAFSVFSHLSGPAHEAWAHELGRVVRPGGVVAVTVLGEEFIDMVEGAQRAVAAGKSDAFSTNMAPVFADVDATRAGFRADRVQFGATGGGGVRTSDYYGWAATSRRCIERTWGAAGFELIRWRPSGELFSQALAVLVRSAPSGRLSRRVWRARQGALHELARQSARLRRLLPRAALDVLRAARRVLGSR